ncbi:MAG: hypothetical protein ACUVQ0_03130 [Thermoproteota archaeon]
MDWIFVIGGIVAVVAAIPTGGATLPIASAMLTGSKVMTAVQIGSDVGEAIAAGLEFGDVYDACRKITTIYSRELIGY